MKTLHRLALPLFVAASALSLAACKGEADKPQAAASSAPDAKPGVAVKDARVVLPAVSGNPAAAYLVIDNQGKTEVSVAAVSVKGAGRTEIHTMDGDQMKKVDFVRVEPLTHMDFTPGKLHVMVFDLGSELAAGGETEVTLTFTDGDKISVPAKVEAMGDAAMGGMKMEH